MAENSGKGLAISSVVLPVALPALGGLIFGYLGLAVGLLVGGVLGLIFARSSAGADTSGLSRAGLALSIVALVATAAIIVSLFIRV